MKKLNKGLQVLLSVVLAIIAGIIIGLTYDNVGEIDYETSIPPCPDTSRPMYYDFSDGVWMYVYRSSRAKAINGSSRQAISEKELQEYLEKNVPDYQEDTYWGEEYGD